MRANWLKTPMQTVQSWIMPHQLYKLKGKTVSKMNNYSFLTQKI